jgi:hypothetical protein
MAENNLSQLAECGVIENITLASREREENFPSTMEFHQW